MSSDPAEGELLFGEADVRQMPKNVRSFFALTAMCHSKVARGQDH